MCDGDDVAGTILIYRSKFPETAHGPIEDLTLADKSFHLDVESRTAIQLTTEYGSAPRQRQLLGPD